MCQCPSLVAKGTPEQRRRIRASTRQTESAARTKVQGPSGNRMGGKEQQDPNPKVKGLECHATGTKEGNNISDCNA